MSVKTLRNQLLAAIAMVLVAALALGSSTFAWFASTQTVTAGEMKVQATTEEGLLIASYTGTTTTPVVPALNTFATTANSEIHYAESAYQTANLYPISTPDGASWFHSNSTKVNESVQTSMTYTAITANLDQYRSLNKFQVKATNAEQPVYISEVTATPATTNSGNLNKAIRIAVKVTDPKTSSSSVHFFAPKYTNEAVTTFKYVASASDTTGTAYTSESKFYVGTTKCEDKVADVTSTTFAEVEIYVYYEGEDVNTTTNNAVFNDNSPAANAQKITIDTINVTVKFSSQVPTNS